MKSIDVWVLQPAHNKNLCNVGFGVKLKFIFPNAVRSRGPAFAKRYGRAGRDVQTGLDIPLCSILSASIPHTV